MSDAIHSLPRGINTFANNPLNRRGELRNDKAWLDEKLRSPDSLVIPFWRLQPLILPPVSEEEGPDAGWLRPDMVKTPPGTESTTIFLGTKNEKAFFAKSISAAIDAEKDNPFEGIGEFQDLRAMAGVLPAGDAAILAQAKSMIDWHDRHKFCAACGNKTKVADAGYKRECERCESEHFPRTDPVVIMIVTHGDKALLGRGPQWPKRMFSALAGFVEPGETIEEATAREVHEETGIRVKSVSYHSSQPWPFPSSLMIGCIAEAETTEITLDETELAEAAWFDKRDLVEAVEVAENNPPYRGPKHLPALIPPPFAIAHQIIKAWACD